MKEKLNQLIRYALEKKASDIHLNAQKDMLEVTLRIHDEMVPVRQDIWKKELLEYVKFIAGMDLTLPYQPQSGQFTCAPNGNPVYCRFSLIRNQNLQTGVIRLLNGVKDLRIGDLTSKREHRDFLESLIHARQGLVIACGPTNSGKTTTLHAILHEIAVQSRHKVVSLEDPIEIADDRYLQLQVNEKQGFTLEKGIEELLRHDPDVLFIGETRNAYTARMVIRAALTGSLAFTTLHAGNALEALGRLRDLGIPMYDLQNTLSAVIGQRLYRCADGKECIYEILSGKDLTYVLETGRYPEGFKTLQEEIREALAQQRIQDPQAFRDLEDLQRRNGAVFRRP